MPDKMRSTKDPLVPGPALQEAVLDLDGGETYLARQIELHDT